MLIGYVCVCLCQRVFLSICVKKITHSTHTWSFNEFYRVVFHCTFFFVQRARIIFFGDTNQVGKRMANNFKLHVKLDYNAYKRRLQSDRKRKEKNIWIDKPTKQQQQNTLKKKYFIVISASTFCSRFPFFLYE